MVGNTTITLSKTTVHKLAILKAQMREKSYDTLINKLINERK
jgi:predicted HicB family RNase H-like nuclease